MKLIAYLSFDGRCREAFEFYARVLGGEIKAMISHGDTPAKDHVPAGHHDKIINAWLVAGEAELMGADSPPGFPSEQQGVSISIQLDDPQEGRRVFEALSEGGSVTMPFGETFWAKGFGMAKDRYGTNWMVNSGQISA